jgi:hypothetical protein
MTSFLEFLSNNALTSTLLAAIILGGVPLAWKKMADRRHRNLIHAFLVASEEKSEYRFRSTHAIASHTKLSKKRVSELCPNDRRIRRNEKGPETWTLVKQPLAD